MSTTETLREDAISMASDDRAAMAETFGIWPAEESDCRWCQRAPDGVCVDHDTRLTRWSFVDLYTAQDVGLFIGRLVGKTLAEEWIGDSNNGR